MRLFWARCFCKQGCPEATRTRNREHEREGTLSKEPGGAAIAGLQHSWKEHGGEGVPGKLPSHPDWASEGQTQVLLRMGLPGDPLAPWGSVPTLMRPPWGIAPPHQPDAFAEVQSVYTGVSPKEG